MAFAPAPASQTFLVMKTKVAAYILATDADALTQAGHGINEAIKEFNTKRWKAQLDFQDHTLVAGTAEYEMEAAFKAPRKAELISSGKACGRLPWLGPKQFLLAFPVRNTNGTPSYYTVENANDLGQIVLSCPPDAGFVSSYPTLRIWFYRRANVLSGDSDTLDIQSEAEPFIEWRAKEYIAANYDQSKVGHARARASELWRAIVKDDTLLELGDWDE